MKKVIEIIFLPFVSVAAVFFLVILGICAVLFRALVVPFLKQETRERLCDPE